MAYDGINKWRIHSAGYKQALELAANRFDSFQTRLVGWFAGWLVGWEINVPFQHKNRLYRGQAPGWRFSSAC